MVSGACCGVIYEEFLGHRVILQTACVGTKADTFTGMVWKKDNTRVSRDRKESKMLVVKRV